MYTYFFISVYMYPVKIMTVGYLHINNLLPYNFSGAFLARLCQFDTESS